MIPVPPDTLSLEQIREPQPSRNLRLMQKLVSVLRLANDEFTNLHDMVSTPFPAPGNQKGKLTWSSVSVIVCLETRAYPLLFRPL